MGDAVETKASRRLAARESGRRSVWFGLGMFGIVGWSIAVPTLAGVALGLWLDARWPGRISWTLTLIFLGIGLGCFNAWRWVNKENDND
ncbi:MAG: AtpZ/AtpI family protein [Pseudomonadota bacterium]